MVVSGQTTNIKTGKELSMHPLRGSGTCGHDRLELRYAEKHRLEFSVSGPIWAHDVQSRRYSIKDLQID